MRIPKPRPASSSHNPFFSKLRALVRFVCQGFNLTGAFRKKGNIKQLERFLAERFRDG